MPGARPLPLRHPFHTFNPAHPVPAFTGGDTNMEKMTMTDSTIAFIGLGLIGGSIARAIRKTRPDIRIMAYMRSRSRLEQARKEGIVDVILDGIDENLRECDLIFLCTPVEYNAGYLSAIRPYLKQGALITDVGSTKSGIHEEIRRQGLEYCFVGGQKIHGKIYLFHKNGSLNLNTVVIQGKTYSFQSDGSLIQ